ncbi:MAG: hypothetical protein ABI614_23685, partial [Planctomycetota bacterium]
MDKLKDQFAARVGCRASEVLATILVILACQVAKAEDGDANNARSTESPRIRQLGTLANADILESSGLAASLDTPNLLWTHNDSGDGPRLFAFDESGRDRGVISLTGIKIDDW